jgi:uncharacterized protein
MNGTRTYPEGVPSWIDIEQPDLAAAQEFYGGVFGWSFEPGVSSDVSAAYVVARLDGREAAGLGATPMTGDATRVPSWNTYMATADADAVVRRIIEAGGRLVAQPANVGDEGRAAAVVDPAGAAFRLWQAGNRPGVQAANVPGAWNFSYLQTSDPTVPDFYARVFGWEFDDVDFATLIRCPGYGDHLAATVDPDIRERQASVATPPRFEDAIGWLTPAHDDEPPHWHVAFTVADRDDTAAAAERLGATVVTATDTEWTHDALIRDPQGGISTASQFVPPER